MIRANSLLNIRNLLAMAIIASMVIIPSFIRYTPFPMHVLIMMCFYGLLGTAWNIIGGYVGLVSLGHVAYYGIGAYVSTLTFLQFGVTPWLGLLLGAVTASVLSFIIGIPSIRFKGGGAFFAMVSIAFAEIVRLLFLNLKIGGGGMGIGIPVMPESFLNFQFHETKLPYYYIILSLLFIELYIVYRISKSRMGYSFVAIRENEVKAETLGINTSKYKLIAFAISAFFTAIAGVFYAQYVLYFDPYTVFPLELSVYMCLVATIGGRGTVLGPVLGAFVLTPLSEYSRAYLGGFFSGFSLVIYGILLMVVVITIPQGIVVWVRRIYHSIIG